MAREGYLILDSDLHMMEPDDLWVRYLDEPYRSSNRIDPVDARHRIIEHDRLEAIWITSVVSGVIGGAGNP